MTAPRTWTLVIDWLPLTPANRWTGHWSKRAALVTAWKHAAIQAARLGNLPKDLVGFRVTVQARHHDNHLTDMDAMAPAAKAIVDGLVAGPKGDGYGLCPDDDARWVHGLTLLPSFLDRSQPSALIVTVTECGAPS